jgi:hypothetical protein
MSYSQQLSSVTQVHRQCQSNTLTYRYKLSFEFRLRRQQRRLYCLLHLELGGDLLTLRLLLCQLARYLDDARSTTRQMSTQSQQSVQ